MNRVARGSRKDRVNSDKAHAARMYDFYLDGKDNYEIDRVAAADAERVFPTVRVAARANRDFMHRATRYLAAECGIRQFLDIGTGIPTEPNLHQVAQEIAPESRVVYVDHDPIVLSHARAMMTGTREGATTFVRADVRRPETIVSAPVLNETLDLTQPVGLSLVAVMHFVSDQEDPFGAVGHLVEALAPGSFLVMTHCTADFDSRMNDMIRVGYHDRGLACVARSREEFARFFVGLDMVDPGIDMPHLWHAPYSAPRPTDADVSVHAGVACKPSR